MSDGAAWYAIFAGDQRRLLYLKSAFKRVRTPHEIWIPQQKVLKRSNDGREVIEVMKPLLIGYAFVHVDLDRYPKLEEKIRFHCGGKFLKRPGEKIPYKISDKDIAHLKKLEKAKGKIDPLAKSFDIQVGDKIEIATGSFKGFSGYVTKLKRSTVVVNLSIFGRELPTEVDPECCMVV